MFGAHKVHKVGFYKDRPVYVEGTWGLNDVQITYLDIRGNQISFPKAGIAYHEDIQVVDEADGDIIYDNLNDFYQENKDANVHPTGGLYKNFYMMISPHTFTVAQIPNEHAQRLN